MSAQRGYAVADLEAVIIHKITGFIRWPEMSGRANAPLKVIVLGASPLAARLAFLYRQGSPLGSVRSVEQLDEIGAPHVLFVTGPYADRMPEVLALLGNHPTLIVGDSPGLAARGASVNLYREGDRVRFEVNRRALHRRGLHASYQLLVLSRIVEGP